MCGLQVFFYRLNTFANSIQHFDCKWTQHSHYLCFTWHAHNSVMHTIVHSQDYASKNKCRPVIIQTGKAGYEKELNFAYFKAIMGKATILITPFKYHYYLLESSHILSNFCNRCSIHFTTTHNNITKTLHNK